VTVTTDPIEAIRAVYTDSLIVVLDDEPAVTDVLKRILERAGYKNVRTTTDPTEFIDFCCRSVPDLVLLDLHMPKMDGITVMRELQQREFEIEPMVLVITGDITAESRARALSSGAKDFLSKPFDVAEVLLRIHNLLDLRAVHRALHAQNQQLEVRVRERTEELEDSRREAIEKLALAAEFRDDDTGRHTRRVGELAAALAQTLRLDPDEVELIARAAPLHDVGKIAIPDQILLKAGRLTPEEERIMRTHTEVGGRLLGRSRSPLLQTAADIAWTHHERWDGKGYPRGLERIEIPLAGRIVALADVYDALTHDRPYRPAYTEEVVLRVIDEQRGQHFDPDVVIAFFTMPGKQRALDPVG
jgi:putative two-component system response regulator